MLHYYLDPSQTRLRVDKQTARSVLKICKPNCVILDLTSEVILKPTTRVKQRRDAAINHEVGNLTLTDVSVLARSARKLKSSYDSN